MRRIEKAIQLEKALEEAKWEGNLSKTEAEENRQFLSQELSLRLHATYVPLNPQGKSPELVFDFSGTLRPGVPEVVAAKAAPEQDQPSVVLVLTPWYEIIR